MYQIFGLQVPEINLEVLDPNLDSIWFTLNTSGTPYLYNDSIDQELWNATPDGHVLIEFYANDSLGHISSEIIIILKDTTNPLVQINSPNMYEIFGNTAPEIGLNISDSHLDSVWYTFNTSEMFYNYYGSVDPVLWDNTSDGYILIKFYVNDSAGNNASDSIILIKDTTVPEINILSPSMYQIFGLEVPEISLEVFDPHLDSILYTFNTSGTLFNYSGSISPNLWDTANDGHIFIEFYALDSAGNNASDSIVLIKDTTPPEINILSPSLYQIFGLEVPEISLEVLDPHLDSIWYKFNSTDKLYIFNGTIDPTLWNISSDGYILIEFYANDSINQINSNSTIIIKDTTPPEVNILSPSMYQIFGLEVPEINLEVSDLYLESIWYKFNSSDELYIYNGTIDPALWNNMSDGSILIEFYANDSAVNIGFDFIVLIKDTIQPEISILSPSIYQMFGIEVPEIQLEVSDPHLDSIWYTFNTTNDLYNFNDSIDQILWNTTSDGYIFIEFYANDSTGNVNSDSIIIIKDTFEPIVIINSPSMYKIFGGIAPDFDIRIDELYLDIVWFTINTTIGNYTFSGEMNQNIWNDVPDGPLLLNFYAKDIVGNIGSNSLILVKDTIQPIINIISPSENDIVGENAPNMDIEILDIHLDSSWYSFQDGLNNYSFSGSIDQNV
jgi:hypothetical protein